MAGGFCGDRRDRAPLGRGICPLSAKLPGDGTRRGRGAVESGAARSVVGETGALSPDVGDFLLPIFRGQCLVLLRVLDSGVPDTPSRPGSESDGGGGVDSVSGGGCGQLRRWLSDAPSAKGRLE